MKWPIHSLGQVLALEYGSALKESERDQSGRIPVAGSNGVVGYHSKALVNGPGVVVGRKGSAGEVTWFEGDFWPIDTTYYVRPLIPCHMRWAYYLLKSLRLGSFSIVTGVPGLNRNDAYRLQVPLPAPSEQCGIVEILDQADALRRKRAEADSKADRILPALFYKMFGDPITNPQRWHEVPLSKMLRQKDGALQSGPFGSSLHNSDFLESGTVLAVGIDNVHDTGFRLGRNRRITAEKYEEIKKYRLEPGDVLITVMGTVGRTCVFPEWVGTAICTKHVYRIQTEPSELNPDFLSASFRFSPKIKMQLSSSITGQIVDAITSKHLRELLVQQPPLHLQERFAQIKKELDGEMARRGQASLKQDLLFEAILHRAFAGDLTAKWRESHMKELLVEMEDQARALAARSVKNDLPVVKSDRHAGYDMYNKAALAAYIVHRCHDESQPLGRVKLAKLYYLAQSMAKIGLTETFAKRAAGPLDDEIFKFLSLAQKNRWVILDAKQGQLKPVRPGPQAGMTAEQAAKVLGAAKPLVDEMLDQMKSWSYQTLERWATVLEAVQFIASAGQPTNVEAVKDMIRKHPEWVRKLNRHEFSDANIEATLRGLCKLGFVANHN
ncbi:restriction endonuclease subunit S [Nitrospira sp. Nam80]